MESKIRRIRTCFADALDGEKLWHSTARVLTPWTLESVERATEWDADLMEVFEVHRPLSRVSPRHEFPAVDAGLWRQAIQDRCGHQVIGDRHWIDTSRSGQLAEGWYISREYLHESTAAARVRQFEWLAAEAAHALNLPESEWRLAGFQLPDSSRWLNRLYVYDNPNTLPVGSAPTGYFGRARLYHAQKHFRFRILGTDLFQLSIELLDELLATGSNADPISTACKLNGTDVPTVELEMRRATTAVVAASQTTLSVLPDAEDPETPSCTDDRTDAEIAAAVSRFGILEIVAGLSSGRQQGCAVRDHQLFRWACPGSRTDGKRDIAGATARWNRVHPKLEDQVTPDDTKEGCRKALKESKDFLATRAAGILAGDS